MKRTVKECERGEERGTGEVGTASRVKGDDGMGGKRRKRKGGADLMGGEHLALCLSLLLFPPPSG